MQSNAKTVSQYLSELPPNRRESIEKVVIPHYLLNSDGILPFR